ncbi:MAG: helix-turn-helix transcriptional regulator [Candidatus Heimdallarchaeota archaeon]|nr:helix-turn-helix transcriptional regulator [Candidatus Heimdallarchaeota archaeon]MBY8992946.1 helix-turn-helix transcriptional regulator [Candidatus Heimdallarchaeota archaeon]
MNAEKSNEDYILLEILGDPVRAQIYFEAMIQEEVTAKQLMKKLTINRSTLTHHLVKMVEASIFEVRVQTLGRPVKFYRISESLNKKVVIEKSDKGENLEQTQRQRIAYMESAIAHLQVITTTTQRITKQLIEEVRITNQKKEIKKPQLMTFSFSLLTEKEAEVLSRKYSKFLKELQEELKELKDKNNKEPSNYLMFSGLIPIS